MRPFGSRNTWIFLLAWAAVVALLFSVLKSLDDERQDRDDEVVALVDGEPVYNEYLERGLPFGTVGEMRRTGRRIRLDRLIYLKKMAKFMEEQAVRIPQEDVARRIEEFRKNPPALSCSCCRAQSLEQFLEFNFMTLQEFRALLEANMAMDGHLDALWEREKARHEPVASWCEAERGDIATRYAKAYHIFFNAFQDPAYRTDPQKVMEEKEKQADAVWRRSQEGETLDDLARQFSEDVISKDKGGLLGCVQWIISDGFTKALLDLPMHPASARIRTEYGYHIVWKRPMTGGDILGILEREFKQERTGEIMSKLDEETKVEIFLEEDPEEARESEP